MKSSAINSPEANARSPRSPPEGKPTARHPLLEVLQVHQCVLVPYYPIVDVGPEIPAFFSPSRNIYRLDAVFGALSDPTRRAILERLAHSECSVTSLSQPFRVSAPAISKHLRVLESAGLITRSKTGRVHYCRLRYDPLGVAEDWIEQQRAFCEQQFDSLAKYLGEEHDVCSSQPPSKPESLSACDDALKSRAKPSTGRGQTRNR